MILSCSYRCSFDWTTSSWDQSTLIIWVCDIFPPLLLKNDELKSTVRSCSCHIISHSHFNKPTESRLILYMLGKNQAVSIGLWPYPDKGKQVNSFMIMCWHLIKRNRVKSVHVNTLFCTYLHIWRMVFYVDIVIQVKYKPSLHNNVLASKYIANMETFAFVLNERGCLCDPSAGFCFSFALNEFVLEWLFKPFNNRSKLSRLTS